MNKERARELLGIYRAELLESVVPFWLKHGVDREQGGYYGGLERDGKVYDSDKYGWFQGRAAFIFARLCNLVEKRADWLEASRLGIDFIKRHCLDGEGRMYFRLSREGKPLYKPWAIFGEAFAAMALAEYAAAAGDDGAAALAGELYWRIVDWLDNPGKLPHHGYPENRPALTHAEPMIVLNLTEVMREALPDERYDKVSAQCLERILKRHYKPELGVLLETVGPGGEPLGTPEGRCVNPGHMIESAWFVMHEGERLGERGVIEQGMAMARHAMRWGWDDEHGGILYYRDLEDKPVQQLEWEMKLWWPHTEALYALLLARVHGEEAHFSELFEKVHEWSFRHFPDKEHGEWFGYLRRDGSVSNDLKASIFKGCFHVPRALLYIVKLLERVAGPGIQDTGRGTRDA